MKESKLDQPKVHHSGHLKILNRNKWIGRKDLWQDGTVWKTMQDHRNNIYIGLSKVIKTVKYNVPCMIQHFYHGTFFGLYTDMQMQN